MISLAPLTLAAALLSPGTPGLAVAPQGTGDAVVLYSAGLEALLSAPKDAALARALAGVAPHIVSLFEGYGVDVDPEIVTLVHGFITRPFCFRIGDDGRGETFTQWTIRYFDEAAARRAAETLVALISDGGLRFTDPSEGSHGFVAMTPGGPLTIDAGTGPAGPRLAVSLRSTREETFTFPGTGLPAGQLPNFVFQFDGVQVGAFLAPIASGLWGRSLPVGPKLILDMLAGPDAPDVSYATTTSGERGISVLELRGWAASGRRAGTLVEEPLGRDDFARVPADATWARMAQWRPAAYLNLLDRMGPGTADGMVGQVRAMTGVDLRTDLLDHIGPTISAYTSRSTGGGLFSTVLLLESDDSAALAQSVKTLWSLAAPLLAAQSEGRVDVRTWESNGAACATIVFPGMPVPIEPSFAAADGVVVCALGRGALTAALDQLSRGKGLSDHARLANVPKTTFDGLVGFGFYDTPRFVIDGYGMLALGAGAFANLMHERGDSSDLFENVLPTPRVLASRVRPSVSFTRIKGDDIVETTTRDGSVLANLSACCGGPLGETQGLLFGIPIVAAVAIPSLMNARLTANEIATNKIEANEAEAKETLRALAAQAESK